MIKSNLVSALRNLLAAKLFALINLGGLALGIASSILIGLFVLDELGYDRQHPDVERLYRVSRQFYNGEGSDLSLATNAPQVAALLKADFPQVEAVTRLFAFRILLGHEDQVYKVDGFRFVDANFFQLFQVNWLQGEAGSALSQPDSLVLTESLARRYFGEGNPLGQTLEVESGRSVRVTGVIADLPHDTHLSGEVFAPMALLEALAGPGILENWGDNSFHTYIQLRPDAHIDSLRRAFPAFLNRHVGEGASQWTALSAIPVRDIHLQSTRQFELTPPGSMSSIYGFGAVALSILVIACFNFMNLSTARSLLRAREVGVRKTIGARRSQLLIQFLVESMLLVTLAAVLALVLVELALPLFARLIDKPLSFDLLSDPALQLWMLGIVVVGSLIAATYPAFFLSSFKPVRVLKSRQAVGNHNMPPLRNLLVVLQFAAAIVLLVATAVVVSQMRYARNLELGFQRDGIVVLPGSPSLGLGDQWQTMREELLAHAEILDVTASNILPLQENLNAFRGRSSATLESRDLPFMYVDYDFFETYGIASLAGRTFRTDFPNDALAVVEEGGSESTGNFILNESAAASFGWSAEEAVGQLFEVYATGDFSIQGRIVGIVEDSHFESLHFTVKPLVFLLTPSGYWGKETTLADASLRISARDIERTLVDIETIWQRFLPEYPLSRRFLDADFEALYLKANRQAELLLCFAALAVLIACLGLFGLASFSAQRRRKEVGVRKVMGGSVWSIVRLLTNDFSKLVLIANVIAWPVAYFVMQNWLSNFAYRVDLSPVIFIGSGLIALCIAWVTVGGTAAKAASARPVLALRYE